MVTDATNSATGCAASSCGGDPHLYSADGTYLDAYQRDGVFRVMDYLVFDRETGLSELVSMDGMTTSSGQTYFKWLTVRVGDKEATVSVHDSVYSL